MNSGNQVKGGIYLRKCYPSVTQAALLRGRSTGKQRSFGYLSIFGDHRDEWGYLSLDELESVSGPFGIGIERDLYFRSRPISELDPRALRYRE